VPIKVALQTIHGKEIGEVLGDRAMLNRILPIGDPRFPMLRYVDPDSNTIFNSLQMYPVLEELDRLVAGTSDEEEKDLLGQVRKLAIHCRDHPQEYLRFIGD
jgi:hypothetical protein